MLFIQFEIETSKAKMYSEVLLKIYTWKFWSLAVLTFILQNPAAALAQDQVKQYDEGSVYEGSFKNGLRNGLGKYTMPDGFTYEGEWKDDQIQGKGVARYPTGQIFEGFFEQGVPDGEGTMTFSDGTKYEGSWLDGKMEGDGVLSMTDGSIYKGKFSDNNRDGYGEMNYSDGSIFKGNWKNN